MHQLKSIYNSPFKNSHSHPIQTCFPTITSNGALTSDGLQILYNGSVRIFRPNRTGYRGNLKVDYSLHQSAALNMLTLANSMRRGNTVPFTLNK